MRAKSVLLAVAILAFVAGPAAAQYPAPLIGGWLLPSEPVAPSGSEPGKGDAPQNCTTVPAGRGGSHVVCSSNPKTPAKK